MSDNRTTTAEAMLEFSAETIKALNNLPENLQLLIGDFVTQMNSMIEEYTEDDDLSFLQKSLELLYRQRLPALLAWMPSQIIRELHQVQPEALRYADELSLEDAAIEWPKLLIEWIRELPNLRFLRLSSGHGVDLTELTEVMLRLEAEQLLPKLVKISFSDQELVITKRQLREAKKQELLQARAGKTEVLQVDAAVDEFTVANSSVAGDVVVQQLFSILKVLTIRRRTLDKLDLSELNFNVVALAELCGLLESLQLEELAVDLSSTAFKEAEIIQLPATVRTLVITQAAPDLDVQLLKKLLQSCPELETLTIRGNPNVELESLLRSIHPLCPQAILRLESKFGITGVLPDTVTAEVAAAREQRKSKVLEKLPFDDFDGDIPTNYQSWPQIDTRHAPQLNKQAADFLAAVHDEAGRK